MSEAETQTTDSDATEQSQGIEFAIEQSKLKETIDDLQTLVDEAKLRLREDGLHSRAVDPANVGMIDLTLEKEAFESYPEPDEDAVLGVNLDRLSDVVGMGSSGDLVFFELDAETRKLEIRVDGLEYSLALIDPDSIRQEPDIPELDLPAAFSIPTNQLSRAIKAGDMVSDHIRFRFDEDGGEDKAVIEADGDTDTVEVVVTPDRGLEVDTAGEADSLFSLDYFGDVESAFPSGGMVRVELGEEFPTKMRFDFAEGHGRGVVMIAPRIQSD